MNKQEYKQLNSELRRAEYSNHALKLHKYDVSKHGILAPKTHCAYRRILARYPNQVCFGLEIEIENVRDPNKLAPILKPLQEYYCCTDGSLRNNGIEIVVAPRPIFDYSVIKKVLEQLQKIGCTSHDQGRCGLHIHVGYNTLFTYAHAEKVRMFVCKHQKLFKTLSRRKKTEYTEKPFYYCPFIDDSCDRYRAVNVNTKTCEFRFFRGTLHAASFLASLECIESLIGFVISTDKLTLPAYKKYVNRSFYPYLRKYLEKNVPQLQVRRLTEEEKQERKQRAQAKKLAYFAFIDRIIARSLPYLNTSYMPLGISKLSDKLPVQTTRLKIDLRGNWNRRYLDAYYEANNGHPSRELILPWNFIPRHTTIKISRRLSWGRQSINAYIN